MRKIISLLIAVIIVLCLAPNLMAQEELRFIETRQAMADNLTAVKETVNEQDWAKAKESFDKANEIWQNEVKPILDGPNTDRYKEYTDRKGEVEANLNDLGQLLVDKADGRIEEKVNATIWALSHQPRGFDVGEPVYNAWDWVFALSIGIGFCIFIICFGLYLRRSYYRRYGRQNI